MIFLMIEKRMKIPIQNIYCVCNAEALHSEILVPQFFNLQLEKFHLQKING